MSKQQAVYKIKAVLDVSDIKSNSKAIQNSLAGVKLSGNLKNQFNTLFNDLEREVDSFQQKMNEGFNNAGDIKALQKSANNITKIYSSITKEIEKIGNKDLSQFADFDTTEIKTAKKELQELQKVLNQKLDAAGLNDVNQAIKDIQKVSKNKNIESFLNAFKTGDIETAQKSLEALRKSASGFSNQTNLTTFNAQLDKMEASLRQLETVDGLQDVAKNMQLLKTRIETLNADQIAKVMRYIDGLDTATREASVAQQQYTDKVLQSASAQNQLNNEIEEVKSRVKYFFTLANGVELFKRAVRDAFETVKELDAAMTETAVVTDFTVGDLWGELPRYADEASKLGATLQGAYETMTLFYQQGLDTNEAFALGTETMKMARIAGLEYKDATDLMTAALRGFKMELNEVSAQRVNDVYSELAAITAADTNEIATAMTKTASIADSANMEFETTAAFLSQMIETTREPAENLGTAMKTIIARFTEMKKAPGEIFEFEGEEVNVNKVDAALASVGVSLKDTNGEFRDLDDVFLDLAKKWDTLDIMSQRYIATTAAGSRQQSRFIAMMSDYERTMELVEAAQDSTGASQKQFEKTQESLEAKINRLKIAWQEFTLGLANNEVIKGAVDLLTKLLEKLNNISDSSNGTVKSIQKIGIVLGAFLSGKLITNLAGKGLTNLLSGVISEGLKKAGQEGGEELAKGIFGKLKEKGAKQSFLSIFKEGGITKSIDLTADGMNAFVKKMDAANISAHGLGGVFKNLGKAVTSPWKGGVAAIKKFGGALGGVLQLAGPYIAFAAIIAGIVAVLKLTYDAAHAYEKEMQDATEATKKAKEAAENAEEAYNNLLSTLENYDNAVNALNTLEKGTNEWKQQLLETNEIILDLLDKYPGLAEYVDSTGGKLSLKPGGEDYLIDTAFQQQQNAQIGLAGAQLRESETTINASQEVLEDAIAKTSNKAETNWTKEVKGALVEFFHAYGGAQGKAAEYEEESKQSIELSQEELFDRLIEEYDKDNRLFTNVKDNSGKFTDNFSKVAKELGVLPEELYELADSVKKYSEDLAATNVANEKFISSILSAAASTELLEDEISDGLINAFTKSKTSGEYSNEVKTQANALISGSDKKASDTMTTTLSELNLVDTKNELKNLQNIYQALTGTSIEQIEQSFGENAEELSIAIAQVDVGKDMAEAMTEFYENYGQNEAARRLIDILNKSDAELAIEDIDIDNLATSLGISDEELTNYVKGVGYDTAKTLQDALNERLGKGNTKLNNLIPNINEGKLKQYLNNLTKEKYEIAIGLIEDGESFNNFEHFIQTVETKFVLVKVQLAADNATIISQATQELADKLTLSGLEKESLDAFNSSLGTMKSIYNENKTAADDWATVSKKGIIDQINYLTDLAQIQAGIDPGVGAMGSQQAQEIAEAQKLAQVGKAALEEMQLIKAALQQEIEEIESNPVDLEVNADKLATAKEDLEALDEQIENMSQFAEIPDPYESIIASGNALIAQSEAIYKASSLIGEGFVVAADDIKALRQLMPELLVGAEQVGEGTIKLSQETMKAVLGDEMAILKGDTTVTKQKIQNKIAEIDAAILDAETKLQLAKQIKDGTLTLDAQTKQKLTKNTETYESYVRSQSDQTEGAVSTNTGKMANAQTDVGDEATATANDFNNITKGAYNAAKNSVTSLQSLQRALRDTGSNAYNAGLAINSIGTSSPKKGTYVISGHGDSGGSFSTTYKKTAAKDTASLVEREFGGKNIYGTSGPELSKDLTANINKSQKDLVNSVNKAAIEKINSSPEYTPLEKQLMRKQINSDDLTSDLISSNDGKYKQGEGIDISEFDVDTYIDDKLKEIENLKSAKTELQAYLVQIESQSNLSQTSLKNAQIGKGGKLDSNKGSSSKDKEIKKYIDETDQSYNTLRAIEVENRKQDKLQTAYDNLVENDEASLQDLMNNLADQEASLIEEQALDKKLINERKQQLQKVLSDNKDLQKYASIDWSTGEVNINLNAVKSLEGTSAEEGTVAARYQDYIKDLETASKNYIDAQKDYDATTQDLLELRRTDAKSDFEGARYDNSITWLNAVESELKSAKNEQEILEKEYNALLENRNATGGEIANSLSRQKKNLEQQQALQQELLRLNKYYMQDLLDSNKDLQKYANYNWGTGVVEINADAIGKIVNEEEGKRVTEYISELEKFRDQINDANGSLLEIDNSVKEIEKQGQDERLDLEQRVLDALTKQHQDEIDALTELDEDINEASEDFISAMEEAIAKERQERENAEKEQSIRDKETRLAYLKRDTTGGNQQEIKQLEKELADEKQDYSDNLIDQKLEELRKQNDEASEQRQEQIELLQKQLEELQENPDWDEIYRIINSSMAANGTLIKGSELDKLLKENEDYGSKSDVGKDVWEEELDKTFGAAAGYVSNSRQLEKLSDKERGVSKGGKVTFINAEGKKISGTYLGDGQGTVEVKSGGYKYLYTDVYRDYDGTYRQTSATPKGQEINPIPEIKDPKPTKPAQPAKKEEPKKQTAKPATPAKKEQPKKETVSYFSKPSYSGASIVDGLKTSVYGKDTKKWPSNKTLYNKVGTLEQIAKANGITGKVADRNTKMLKKLKEGKLKKYKAFAHGGLVDFTGPAWLDGTKTRPEAFLSADDTKNFMELKDVLSSVKKAQNRNTAVSNNASFVINVKVDKIDNDYDVDRLVSRVKQDILQNSQYRNVTSINFRK